MTARTLFSLSGIRPETRRLAADADASATSGVDALFVLESDLASLPADLMRSGAFHVVEIPMSEKLAAVYEPATIAAGEAGSERPAATIAVDTLLTVFDWPPEHPRFRDVSRFVTLFFDTLPKLREEYPNSIWNETDPHASVPGWQRYGHAEKIMASVPYVVPLPISASKAKQLAFKTLFDGQTDTHPAAADPAHPGVAPGAGLTSPSSPARRSPTHPSLKVA